MTIKRRIVIQAVKTADNELIPIWDDRIVFHNTEMYGNIITLKDGGFGDHGNLVECIYDLKTKKVELGIELDYYPSEKHSRFKIGQVVLFEKSHRVLCEAKISEIVYETYELDIKRGRKLDSWVSAHFKDVEIDSDMLYAVKHWKPFYILDNGIKIEWEHQLYNKVE